jgi:hypothetical protein
MTRLQPVSIFIAFFIQLLIDKFKSTMKEEFAMRAFEEAKTQNAIIEEVVETIRNQNP